MFRKREYRLQGSKVVLVPYCAHHVERYHQWMQDPVLRTQTASEPLTLDKEHDMQQSWLTDNDKCTFIILSQELYEREGVTEVDCMAGDVNLFLTNQDGLTIAEIEVMIAEPQCRRKGLGLEATHLMMSYAVIELGVRKFQAKIGLNNHASLSLFGDKLGFREVSRSAVFQEITLELCISSAKASKYEIADDLWTKYTRKS